MIYVECPSYTSSETHDDKMMNYGSISNSPALPYHDSCEDSQHRKETARCRVLSIAMLLAVTTSMLFIMTARSNSVWKNYAPQDGATRYSNTETMNNIEGSDTNKENQGPTNSGNDCCTNGEKSKVLMLLRHAKSSWENISSIDDFDRPLAPKGMAVAHDVGKSLRKMNTILPELILSSPSVRTKETLNIVLKEWTGFDEKDANRNGNVGWDDFFDQNLKNLIDYDNAWYDLSDDGYLEHLIERLNGASFNNQSSIDQSKNTSEYASDSLHRDYDRVMLVGHNPAMEQLLNRLVKTEPLSSLDEDASSFEMPQLHFSPGAFFELCFPSNTWNDMVQAPNNNGYGRVSLHLPLEKQSKKKKHVA